MKIFSWETIQATMISAWFELDLELGVILCANCKTLDNHKKKKLPFHPDCLYEEKISLTDRLVRECHIHQIFYCYMTRGEYCYILSSVFSQ